MTFGGKDNRGPSIAELQRYIREKVRIRFMLNNGEEVVGTLRWFDENAFSILPDGEQPFTILRTAVVGYRKHNGKESGSSTANSAKSAPNPSPPAE
jgi:small nuclear ribonucleoprotein (snRNP)-like protein